MCYCYDYDMMERFQNIFIFKKENEGKSGIFCQFLGRWKLRGPLTLLFKKMKINKTNNPKKVFQILNQEIYIIIREIYLY